MTPLQLALAAFDEAKQHSLADARTRRVFREIVAIWLAADFARDVDELQKIGRESGFTHISELIAAELERLGGQR